jgi:hypothetical protein
MTATQSGRNVRILLIVLALLVLCVVLAIHFIPGRDNGRPDVRLTDGEKYLAIVTDAKLPARPLDDGNWDTGNSAPDCYVEIWWRGNRIHKSSAIPDSLMPSWPERELSVRDAVKSGGSIRARRNAGVFEAKRGEHLVVKLLDRDLAGDDDIGEHKIAVDSLRIGNNEIKDERTRLNLKVVPARGQER